MSDKTLEKLTDLSIAIALIFGMIIREKIGEISDIFLNCKYISVDIPKKN